MPEPTDEELGLDPQQMEGLDPNIRAELRRSRQIQRENAALQAERDAAMREAAFAKAGVPDTPLAAALAKTYEGDNDPAAVKEYFTSLGVDLASGGAPPAGSPPPPAQQGASDEELAAQRRLAQVGAGAEGDGSVDFKDALEAAQSSEEVLALIANAPEGSGIGRVAIQ
jgi:hypothetical protein